MDLFYAVCNVDEEEIYYLTLVYPLLNEKDKEWINNIRKKYDNLYYNIVKEHFTLVFPTLFPDKNEFISEMKNQSTSFKKFSFKIRSAIMNNDRLSDYFYTLLIPDEGLSYIVKIHQKLYSGKINKTLLLDVDFIPHIGVGSFKDKYECKKLVDEINDSNIEISGIVKFINKVKYHNNKVEALEKVELK